MAAYTQFGYGGYPPPVSQILASNAIQSPQPSDATNSINASRALSPSDNAADCRAGTTATNASASVSASTNPVSGGTDLHQPGAPLSPDTLSQNSNTVAGVAGPGSVGTGSIIGLGTSVSSLESSALNQIGTTAGGGAGGGGSVGGPTGSCCENGRPIMTDPVSGQTVCSCQYDSARLALSGYSRLPAANVGVYGAPYPSTDQNPYQSIGVESSAFYSPLSNPYTLKDSTSGNEMSAWTSAGLQPTTGYYSYDPMSAYGYGASYDLAARRKNATRESTATLKAWLNEHKKNPYPTKGEKIMLAIITKMTLTQVSTWFANARRRLKKENKMTWEPKNRTDDDDEALASDDEKEKDNLETNRTGSNASMHTGGVGGVGGGGGSGGDFGSRSSADLRKGAKSEDFNDDDERPSNTSNDVRCGLNYSSSGGSYSSSHPHGYHPYQSHPAYYQHPMHASLGAAAGYTAAAAAAAAASAVGGGGNNCLKNENGDPKNQLGRGCGVPIPASKPKIWSLADTVANKTPPPPAYMGQQQQQQQHHHLEHQSMQHQQSSMMHGHPHTTTPPIHNDQQSQHQHQQQLQQYQHQQQQYPSPMMSNFSAPPYYRAHTTSTLPYGTFPGVVTAPMNSVQCSSSNNNNNNSSSNSNSTLSNLHTPSTPTSHLLGQQPQQQQPPPQHQQQIHMRAATHHPSIVSQRGMGFPEAQPDTPPQTPPNMKLPSVATKLLFSASQVPTTATYRSSNPVHNGGGGGVLTTLSPRAKGVTALGFNATGQYGGVVAGFGSQIDEYSPRDENSNSSSGSCDSGSPQTHTNENNFKPLFKCQQIPVGGYVPHV